MHEQDCEVELVDSRLSGFDEEEVKRLVNIALLCTQTSPVGRPPMSRVVAMLSGDIEVPSASARPGYLTDWKYNDSSSFMTDATHSYTDKSHENLPLTASTIGVSTPLSPADAPKPTISEIVGEGR